MGKGTVASGGAGGLYTINLDYGKARVDSRIAALTSAISTLQTRYTDQYAQYLTERATLEALTAALDSAISAYASSSTPESRQAVVEATEAQSAQSARTSQAKSKADAIQLQLAATEKDKARLQNIVTQETKSAWCVDLTETASGQVATLEVPGEPQRILIAPGARVHTSADGQLLARAAMSPEQAFYNAAILPGVQKHKPNFRVGTITAINAALDLADVTLDAATSSANGLDINIMTELVGIPVQYMTCHAGAFEVGDRVIVQFTGLAWDSPKVIGFLQNPRACGGVIVGLYGDDQVLIVDLNTSTGAATFDVGFSYATNKSSAGIYKYQGKYWTLEAQRTGNPIATSYNTLHSHLGDVFTLAAQCYAPCIDANELVSIYLSHAPGSSSADADSQTKIRVFNTITGAVERTHTIPAPYPGTHFYFSADAAGGLVTLAGLAGSAGYQIVVMSHVTGAEVYRVTPPSGSVLLAECVAMTPSHFAYLVTYGWLGAYSLLRVHSLADGLMVDEVQIPSSQALKAVTMVGRKVILQGMQGGGSGYNGDTMIYELDNTNTLVHQGTYSLFDSLIGSIYFLDALGGK